MQKALTLARRGIGTTHPNPRVGAVVVSDGALMGKGWHHHAGEAHAEPLALEMAGVRACGATLYVTLEPCAAQGRTPACTDAILRAGIRRVVYASNDPNPAMAGGSGVLRAQGIKVTGGVLKKQADVLNQSFFHFIQHGRPYLTAKAAISLDGRLATHCKNAQWISNEKSRRHAHGLRAVSDAIVVGAGTLKHDNPSLTVRGVRCRGAAPLRVVICTTAPNFDADYQLADQSAPSRIYVRTLNHAVSAWERAGVEVVQVDHLLQVFQHLAADGRLAVLVEGGGGLYASLFESRLIDELILYQAPILIGGHQSVGLWDGTGVANIAHAPRLIDISRHRLGGDLMIRGHLAYSTA